ncbi:MAG: 2-oxoacid:acceptor oxidoreductase subunit alpha [Candidatus Competibacter sp.]|nr:2-oxoacid:acceptor oxidoreductase subunit alpha [Candidatus Competibacter sp.]
MSNLASSMNTVAIAIMGSGGAGAITAGSLLLEAAGRAGWHGLMTRSVGPQIRGGEALSMVRLSGAPIAGHGDRFDILLALDWHNADRFVDEAPLDADSLIVADAEAGEPPAAILACGARWVTLPLEELAEKLPGGRSNIVALGVLARLLALPLEPLVEAGRTLARKGLDATRLRQALSAGHEAATALEGSVRPLPAPAIAGTRWMLTGNEAAALGALRGGVRFAAVYPITPATDLSEWLAPRLRKLGGHLIQAEDEIAALNMVLGASYGGVPALTATSGPGLALMTETLGLAVAAEIPAVVVDVMRGGPSTGIPTKSEQSDLSIALYGLHGDAPHLVLAPNSVGDCLFATQWAVRLSEALQCPAIVLSDQFLGQSQAVCDKPSANGTGTAPRAVAVAGSGRYDRYTATTADGVSPMALPGTPGGQYTADGLEHNARGTPSSRAADHRVQLDKRRDKLLRYDYGPAWVDVEGEGELAVLTWGSSTGPVREAATRARAQGLAVKVVALRLLFPPQPARLAALLEGVRRVLVVEQSHSQQFHGYLRAHYLLPGAVRVLNQPGPLPIRPAAVLEQLLQWR